MKRGRASTLVRVMGHWACDGTLGVRRRLRAHSGCGAAFDASVNVLCVLGGACGRITVDTASVRPCGGRTARKPTPLGYTRFEAVKTASSVSLVTVPGTVKRPHPDETQPILSTTTTVVRALT